MTRCAFVVGLLTACSFTGHAIDDIPRDGATGDGDPIDAMIDAPNPGVVCYGTGSFKVCPLTKPQGTVTYTSGTIDTGTSPLCVPLAGINPPKVCVVAAAFIHMSGTGVYRVIGDRPLVLLGTDKVQIDGALEIDVASHFNTSSGAGADATACVAGTDPPSNSTFFGGGYGGSFSASGGTGGDGDAASHGVPGGSQVATTLRGGCPGGPGGGTGAGMFGHGGGAIAVISATLVQIDGAINASGAAGSGGTSLTAGGGGAGSGGMILVDAIRFQGGNGARLFANGGGGGEGGGTNLGNPGSEPTRAKPGDASGGSAASLAGDGGNGSLGGDGLPGEPSLAGAGGSGGGGGGGAGTISILVTQNVFTGMSSPNP